MPRVKKDVQALARKHTEGAVKTLVGIMNQPKAAPAARVAAAQAILDRGWGKSTQILDANLKGDLTIEVIEGFSGQNPE